jgi:alcohol dehydrogenase
MVSFDFHPRTRVLFGPGRVTRVGQIARELGFRRTLVVADPGIREAGHTGRVLDALTAAAVETFLFDGFGVNPDSAMVHAGAGFARPLDVDSIIGLGGGSSLDCAKGINFVLTNGGTMRDYRGFGKASQPMLPMIGVPTTAGTGSDAQAYAIISDPVTHEKMACGDPKAAFRAVVLDPVVTVSQPRSLTAIAGFDALSHAVESYVTTTRTDISEVFALDAWRRLESHYETVLAAPTDLDARGAMLLGAHEAGIAIEQSMLGATHACANPLTARHGTTHGVAIAVMLPHVVRWNAAHVGERYRDLLWVCGREAGDAPGERLADRLDELARAGGLPRVLRDLGILRDDLPALAAAAATQWTGTFNPRPFDAAAARQLYAAAVRLEA